jgi:uncharacterized XkdX family phage protein
MSKNYAKIKKWYDMGIYKLAQMKVFVEKGQITAEEYKLITGEDYE